VTEIQVSCEPSTAGWHCSVRVAGGGRESTFDVTTSDPVPFLPAGGPESLEGDVERLVSETFVFLLEREPASSILRSFDLTVVARYFPEYPAEIRTRLAR
jgi:hypothetical protein